MEDRKKSILGRVGLSRFLQLRINTYVIRFLPLFLSRAYLCLLGLIYYSLNGNERQVIEDSISAVLRGKHDLSEIRKITNRTIKGIFTHYHEKLLTAYADHNWLYSFINTSVRLKNQSVLDRALAEGRGVILITGHFGAVEFLPVILALKKYSAAMIVRFKTQRLKKALLDRAGQHDFRILDAEEPNVSFSALKCLKENRILITECDEFDAWRPHQEKTTALFGMRSPLDRTLDALHKKYKSPVVFAALKRGWNDTYALEFHDLNQAPTEGYSITERALSMLENYVYTYPEQWYQWKAAGLYLGLQLERGITQDNGINSSGFIPSTHPVFVASQA